VPAGEGITRQAHWNAHNIERESGPEPMARSKNPAHPADTDDLRTFMGQIRKKIEDHPSNPKYLLTEAYVGYRFCEAH